MFKKTAKNVNDLSNQQQRPWIASNFFGEFSFTNSLSSPSKIEDSPSNVGSKVDASVLELEGWNLVKNSSDPEDFKIFINKFPNGTFADFAKKRIKDLTTSASNTNNSNGNMPDPTPTAVSVAVPTTGIAPTMLSFNFQTVILNANGREIKRNSKQASYYIENFGGVNLEMVYVPAGSFMMGSSFNEQGSSSDERPQHQVRVGEFYIGRYEVTQKQWKAIMGTNPSRFKGDDNLPIESVSWNDVVEFCKRLSDKTGREYRLPSEAEWEYAARGGTTSAYGLGETVTTSIVNCDGNNSYLKETKGEYREKTVRVGSFIPNAFGLYDMHGNVWEWCKDVWHENYQQAPNDGTAWNNGGDATKRVVRGGSWSLYSVFCRSSFRAAFTPDIRDGRFGFRVLVSAKSFR